MNFSANCCIHFSVDPSKKSQIIIEIVGLTLSYAQPFILQKSSRSFLHIRLIFALLHLFSTVYEIQVITGDKRGAGTDAHVFVTIFGDHGQTPRVQLINRYILIFCSQLALSVLHFFALWPISVPSSTHFISCYVPVLPLFDRSFFVSWFIFCPILFHSSFLFGPYLDHILGFFWAQQTPETGRWVFSGEVFSCSLPPQWHFYCDTWRNPTDNPCVVNPHAWPLHHCTRIIWSGKNLEETWK